MKTKYEKTLVITVVVLLLVLGGMIGISWLRGNCVFVGGRLYPKDAAFLNLRGEEVSIEHYNQLCMRLPDCKIYWDVPFQGSRYADDAQQLSITTITDEEIAQLAYFPELRIVDASDSRDYAQLEKLQMAYPQLLVTYFVPIDGIEYPRDTTEITVTNLTDEDVEMLAYLPNLTFVNAEKCTDYMQLAELRRKYPQCEAFYAVTINGMHVDTNITELTLTEMDTVEIAEWMVHLPNVEILHLIDPVGDAQPLLALREANPDITWDLVWDGAVISSGEDEVDLSLVTLNSITDVEWIMSYMPEAEQVYLGMPDMDNEMIAAFRESHREDYKVVWTVMCGEIPVRTDAVYFHPIQEGVYYFFDEDAYNLRYCEDMICVDVGHMSLHDISWVEYMPHLKYLILALTTVQDISPLSTCKELIFLELDMSGVSDYTPLLGCTALEDLNLGMTYGDPTPIAQMTWLKNLWWKDKGYSTRVMLEEALPNTNMNFSPPYTSGGGWRKLQNYYDMRDILGMYYMD